MSGIKELMLILPIGMAVSGCALTDPWTVKGHHLHSGMTKKEVRRICGNPDFKSRNIQNTQSWYYWVPSLRQYGYCRDLYFRKGVLQSATLGQALRPRGPRLYISSP